MRLLAILVSILLLNWQASAQEYFVDSYFQSRVFYRAIDLRVADDRGERSSIILCLKQSCEGIPFQTQYPENMYRFLLRRGGKVSVRTKMIKAGSGDLYRVAYSIFPSSRISGRVEDCKTRGQEVIAGTAYTLSDSKGLNTSAKILVTLDVSQADCDQLLNAEIEFIGTLHSNNRFSAESLKILEPAPVPTPTPTTATQAQLQLNIPTPTPPATPTPTPTPDARQVLKGVTAVFPASGGRAIVASRGCKLSAIIDVDIRGEYEPQVSITTEVDGLVGFPIVSKSRLLRDIKVVVQRPGTKEILFSVANESADDDSNFGGKPRFTVDVNLLMHNRQDLSTYEIEQALRKGSYELKYLFPEGIGCDNSKNADFREILR